MGWGPRGYESEVYIYQDPGTRGDAEDRKYAKLVKKRAGEQAKKAARQKHPAKRSADMFHASYNFNRALDALGAYGDSEGKRTRAKRARRAAGGKRTKAAQKKSASATRRAIARWF